MTLDAPTRFLLMRHADRWDFPKGHCDGEETFEEAARRELTEETGIEVSDDMVDATFQYDSRYDVRYGKRAARWGGSPGEIFPKHVRTFLAFLPTTVKIKVTEHESHEWMLWRPPHQIQTQAIDGLLAAVEDHLTRFPDRLDEFRRRLS